MSDTVILAIIVGIPPTIVAVGNFIMALRNEKKLKGIHDDVNSKMQQLVDTTRSASYAEGVKSETDKGKEGLP